MFACQCSYFRYKIIFFAASLSGGVGRVLVNLIRHLDREHFQPELALVQEKGEYLGEVPEDVPIYNLGKRHVSQTLFTLTHLLRRIQPHLLFSAQDHVNIVALLAKKLSHVPAKTVISVHNTLSAAQRAEPDIRNRVLSCFMRQLYAKAECIVAVSQGAAEDTRKIASILPGKIKVIYNPIVDERIQALAREPVDHLWFPGPIPKIVSVGRLTKQKGYPYLLQAVARILQKRPVKLVILGEGEQREELEDLAHELGIAYNVAFLGYQENPYKYIARADVFVLSSLWEGLPTVLIEAMACGAFVISDRQKDVCELFESGKHLVCVENPEELRDVVQYYLRHPVEREKIAAAGRSEVLQKHTYCHRIEKLLSTVAADK